MQEKILYEYSVIRLLPCVEREEFLNVGIILFSKKAQYIKVIYSINESKLHAFNAAIDIEQVKANLESFKKIALGESNCGPIAQLDLPSRFRWLTAVRSSAIQTSRPHPGLSVNLEETIQRLYIELVS